MGGVADPVVKLAHVRGNPRARARARAGARARTRARTRARARVRAGEGRGQGQGHGIYFFECCHVGTEELISAGFFLFVKCEVGLTREALTRRGHQD